MLDKIRRKLRISDRDFDDEIIELIDSCKEDLKLAGIVNIDEANPLIERAISTYCKANFGIDNPDFEKYTESYNMLKNNLAISKDFTEAV